MNEVSIFIYVYEDRTSRDSNLVAAGTFFAQVTNPPDFMTAVNQAPSGKPLGYFTKTGIPLNYEQALKFLGARFDPTLEVWYFGEEPLY